MTCTENFHPLGGQPRDSRDVYHSRKEFDALDLSELSGIVGTVWYVFRAKTQVQQRNPHVLPQYRGIRFLCKPWCVLNCDAVWSTSDMNCAFISESDLIDGYALTSRAFCDDEVIVYLLGRQGCDFFSFVRVSVHPGIGKLLLLSASPRRCTGIQGRVIYDNASACDGVPLNVSFYAPSDEFLFSTKDMLHMCCIRL